MASKQCMDCRESNIHPLDRHFSCLRCLGPSHDSFNCTFCEQFPEPVRDIRLTLSTESLSEGRWPENWSQQLRKVENTCSQKAKKASQTLKHSQNQGTPQVGDKIANAASTAQSNQNVNQPQTDQNQNEQSPLDNNNNGQGQASSLPITLQGFDIQGLATWQAGINDMMGQMAQNLQSVMEKFDSFSKPAPVESTPKRHKKSKSKSKSKSKGDSVPPPHKKRRKAAETAPNPNAGSGVAPTPDSNRIGDLGVDKSTELDETSQSETGTSLTLPSELGQDFYYTPHPPSFPIPRKPSEGFTPDKLDSDSDSDLEIDINRKDKRKLYLQSLRTLVPSLKHDSNREAKESGHFSLLHKPTTVVPKMPFLDEVYTQVSSTSSPSHPFNKNRSSNLKKVKKYYPTIEPAESGLLALRKVPPEIISQVPGYKLNKNASKPSLNTNYVEGAKEQAAIKSFDYASAAMRIANNSEIGVEAQGSLINRCFSSMDKITKSLLIDEGHVELPVPVQNQLGSIKTSLNLMKQTLFDLKSSNNDLLQLALGQYNESMLQRRNAWLGATQLPSTLVAQLKDSDMAKPKPEDQEGQLPMFSQKQLDSIKQHTDARKDSAIIQLCSQRARGRGRTPGRPRASHRGGVSRGFVPYSHPQAGPQPRGRGRGRPFRSRGNHSQSFARGQGKQTSV